MHYYKFNIADWHLHTAHLTLVEEIVYFKLINHYYETERPFDSDGIDAILRKLRLRSEKEIAEQILEEYFSFKDGKWFHLRCEKEIKDFKKMVKKNKANGSKGGRPKKNQEVPDNPLETHSEPAGNPEITLTNNHKPVTSNQETKTDIQDQIESAFNIFWDAGLQKLNKKKSLIAFKSKCKGKNPIEFANMLSNDIKTRLKNNQFGFAGLYPTTYLNGDRWEDQISTPNQPQKTEQQVIKPKYVEIPKDAL